MNNVITLTLYKGDDEEEKRLTRSFLPWGILEMAIDLQEELADIETDKNGAVNNIRREHVEKLTDFVVFIFGDKVTTDELKKGASVEDMFSVFKQVFAMVGGITAKNPTIGQAANRRKNLKQPAP
jgi:hypothetical protein